MEHDQACQLLCTNAHKDAGYIAEVCEMVEVFACLLPVSNYYKYMYSASAMVQKTEASVLNAATKACALHSMSTISLVF